MDNSLDVGTVYSVMSLLNALRLAMGKKFTRAMETGPAARVAIDRIEEFLLIPEQPPPQKPATVRDMVAATQPLVAMTDAAFQWQAVTPSENHGNVVDDRREDEKIGVAAAAGGA